MGQWADTAAARPASACATGAGAGDVFRAARRRRAGFTLVELLVIVAVIALLLSLMGPTANRAIQLARINKCKSNLHQMGNAAAQYSADNNTYVPRDASGEFAHYQFAACLSPYTTGKTCTAAEKQNWGFVYNFLKNEDIWLCPAVNAKGADNRDFVLNYVINACDFWKYQREGSYPGPAAPPCKLAELPRSPAEILYIVEFNPSYQSVDNFTIYDVWVPGQMPFNGVSPSSETATRMIHAEDMRHDGKTTIVRFDGSAETYRLDPYDIPVSFWNPLDKTRDPQ